MHLEQLSHFAHGLAFLDEPAAEHYLVGRKRRRTAEPNAFLLRRDPPGAGAVEDQRLLELGNASEHG